MTTDCVRTQLVGALGAALALLCAPAFAAAPVVVEASYSGPIIPPAAEYLEAAIDECGRRGCEALLVELDTPGGLDASMRRIVKAVMASEAPVIVYVSPAGARAASAGVFITMAADVAAMAPGTNIGAAHPVELGGQQGRGEPKQDKIMQEKLANDASAYLSAIASKRGRNADWAAYVVEKSSSVPAAEAVRLKIVDLQADGVEALLAALDGRKLAGRSRALSLKGAARVPFAMTRRQKLLAAVSDPNVAMVLMTLGVSGLLIELYSPGLIVPGIIGGVSLLTAFYSFETLSAGYAGFALIGLGLVFMLLELKLPTHGLMGLAGAAAAVFGALMLSRDAGVDPTWVYVSVAALLAVMGGLTWLAARVLGRPSSTGSEGLAGRRGVALTALEPAGSVRLSSETWQAVSESGRIEAGEAIVVSGVDGLTLKVRRAA